MKRLIFVLALFASLTYSNVSHATHVMGGEFWYECLDSVNRVYKIHMSIYRDCSGISLSTSQQIQISFSKGCPAMTVNMTFLSIKEVTPVCKPTPTTCTQSGAPLKGTHRYDFEVIVQFPPNCGIAKVTQDDCCRNINAGPGSITTLASGSLVASHLETEINLDLKRGNNSSKFLNPPVPYICMGNKFSYNQYSVDKDGDSLVFSLYAPYGDASGNPVTYASPLSYLRPLDILEPNIKFNTLTGQYEFTPTKLMTTIMGFKVSEYRRLKGSKGQDSMVYAGYVMRDIQVSVTGTCPPILIDGILKDSVQNANFVDSTRLDVCVTGKPLKYKFRARATGLLASTDVYLKLIDVDPIFKDQGPMGVGYDTAFTKWSKDLVAKRDTVWGAFTYNTPKAKLGCGNISYVIGYCENALTTEQVFTARICFKDNTYADRDTIYYCQGGVPQTVNVQGGDTFTWTPLSGICKVYPKGAKVELCPPVTTKYIVTSNLDVSNTTCKNSDTVIGILVPKFTYTLTPKGDTICQKEAKPLSLVLSNTQAPYKVKWTPSFSLIDPVTMRSSDTARNPIAMPSVTTSYVVDILSKFDCQIKDTIKVNVGGVAVTPYVSPNRALVCAGDTTMLKIDYIKPKLSGLSALTCKGNDITADVDASWSTEMPSANPICATGCYPALFATDNPNFSSKYRILYTKAELNGGGFSGGLLKQLNFFTKTVRYSGNYNNVEVRLGTTGTTNATSFVPMFTVYDSKNLLISAVPGVVQMPFDRFFDWDGVSNIIVEICFKNSATVPNNTWVTASNTPVSQYVYYLPTSASMNSCDMPSATPTNSSNRKPKAQFVFCNASPVGGGLTVKWTGNPANVIMNPDSERTKVVMNAADSFYVNVSGGQSCFGSSATFVGLDTTFKPKANNDTFICNNAVINLKITGTFPPAPATTFSWTSSPPNVIPVINRTKQSFNQPVTTTTKFFVVISNGPCVVYDTVVVDKQTNIPINFTVSPSYCTSNTGKIRGVPTVGVASSYTYKWSLNPNPAIISTADSISNAVSGTYSLTVTNIAGCTGTASQAISSINLTLDIDTLNTDLNCFNDSSGTITPLVLSGSPILPTAYNWDWADLAGTNNGRLRTNLSAGNYSVTVTDTTTKCIGTANINIAQPTKLTINVDSVNLLCNKDNKGGLLFNPAGGTAPYALYEWSHISGTPNGSTVVNFVNSLPAGKYYVTVTDNNGCKAVDSTIVNEPTKLANTKSKTDATFVGGKDGVINSNPTGGTLPYSFIWTSKNVAFAGYPAIRNNQAADSVVGNATSPQVGKGRYYLTVTDANLCAIIDTYDVKDIDCKLGASFVIDSVKCFGQSTGKINCMAYDTLNFAKTTKYIFSISNPVGFTQKDSVPDNLTVGHLNNLPAGTYDIVVGTNLGCEEAYYGLVVKQAPALVPMTTKLRNVSCPGYSDGKARVDVLAAFPGTPPYTYAWSSGNTPTIDSTDGLKAGNHFVTVTDNNSCTASEVVFIDSPQIMKPVLRQDSVRCFGQANGRAFVESVADGTAPFTYKWNTLSTDSTTAPVIAGNYTVTITDNSFAKCTITKSIQVLEPEELKISLTMTPVSCFGLSDGTISANFSGGNGGNVFALIPNVGVQNNNQFTQLPANASYTVTLTDMKGCNTQANIAVPQPNQITFQTGSKNATCKEVANGRTWVKNIGGGTGPYNVVWTEFGSTTQLSNGVSPTFDTANNLFGLKTYTATVTDSRGCFQSLNQVVGVDYVLTIDNIALEHAKCFGSNDGKATVTMANGFKPYNYSWSNPEIPTLNVGNNAIALNIPRGEYTVTVTDVNMCTTSQMVEILEPTEIQINLTPTMTLCYGSADGTLKARYTGGTRPYTSWIWSTNPVQTGDSAIGLKAGSYNFTLIDKNGCVKTKTGIVPEPEEFRVDFTEQKHITCYASNDGKLTIKTIGGTPGFTFLWNTTPPRSSMTIDNLSPSKVYSVTATDHNGCTTSGQREIREPEKLEFDQLLVDSVTCPKYADGVVDIHAIGGTLSSDKLYEYSLDSINFSSYGKFTQLKKGRYTAWIRDNNGCLARRELEIFEPEELFVDVVPNDTLIDLAKQAQLKLAYKTASGNIPHINSYRWYPGEGLSCIDCANPVASAYESRLYKLTTNYHHNCIAKSEAMIRIKDPLDFFVPSAFTPGNHDNLDINDVFKVYGTTIKKVNLIVFNRWGERLFESNNMEIGWDGTYKGEMQVPGVYTWSVEVEYLNGLKSSKKGSVTLIR